MIKTQRQFEQQREEEKFFCNNHSDVEAVVFCETCSIMPGCSGFWCKECDSLAHSVFPGHQRTDPKHFERKTCDKHPGHNSEEIFCWKTKTFHCSSCGYENGIKGDKIPDAIDKIVQDSKTTCSQLRDNLEKLSKQKDMLIFELSDANNPNNLDIQKETALSSIESTFNQMRELLDQRERTLIEEVERHFGNKNVQMKDLLMELNETIEKGKSLLETYDTISSSKKNANVLKRLLELTGNTEKVVTMVNKCENKPIERTITEVVFDGKDELMGKIKKMGKITGTTDVPAPQNFKSKYKGCDFINLSWNKSETALPVTYQVVFKKTDEPDDKWVECYNGPETECKCSNLQENTEYIFKITPIYRRTKCTNSNVCSERTVKDFEYKRVVL